GPIRRMSMRILPRTPRGTWLLAGLVWVAACGALWWTMPIRPRCSWLAPVPSRVLGFLADGTLATCDTPPNSIVAAPVRLWDPSSGTPLIPEALWAGERVESA